MFTAGFSIITYPVTIPIMFIAARKIIVHIVKNRNLVKFVF